MKVEHENFDLEIGWWGGFAVELIAQAISYGLGGC